jgi:undecaprenyl-diphosphatase
MFEEIMLTSIDYQLFIFFNTAFSNPFFDLIIPVLTQGRFLTITMFLASGLHVAIAKDKVLAAKRAAVAILLVGFCDLVGHRIIKEIFDRPRPSHSNYFIDGVHVLFPQCNFLLGQKSSLSFPSNHALTISALATIWALWRPKAAVWLIPVGLFLIFTRVYVGVHYPFDLFFGIVFGSTFAYLTYYFTKSFLVKPRLERNEGN